MPLSPKAQTGRNKYVCCMHVGIGTIRLQPVDKVCTFSGPSASRFGSPLKCKPSALVSEPASGDVMSHQSRSFDDLKRFNNLIVDELA